MKFIPVFSESTAGDDVMFIRSDTIVAVVPYSEQRETDPGGIFRSPKVETIWHVRLLTTSSSFRSTRHFATIGEAAQAAGQILGSEIMSWPVSQ